VALQASLVFSVYRNSLSNRAGARDSRAARCAVLFPSSPKKYATFGFAARKAGLPVLIAAVGQLPAMPTGARDAAKALKQAGEMTRMLALGSTREAEFLAALETLLAAAAAGGDPQPPTDARHA